MGERWAIVTRFSLPARTCSSARFTTFVREDDGPWRRGDERHENVLLDTARLPGVLAQHGLDVRVSSSFGGEELPPTAWTIVGRAVR